MTTTVRIGTFRLDAPREYTEDLGIPAWQQTVRVEPGEYEVTANLGSPGGTSGDRVYWVHIRLPGTITYYHAPPLFGGVKYESDISQRSDAAKIGTPSYASISGVYGWSIAQKLANGEQLLGGTITLDPEWTVQDNGEQPVQSWPGHTFRDISIVRKERQS